MQISYIKAILLRLCESESAPNLLEESLGRFEVLNVFVQTWFAFLHSILIITKNNRITQCVRHIFLEVLLKKSFHVVLQQILFFKV